VTTVAIHQPNYLPWLGYFAKIRRADVFVLLDTVAFQSGNTTSVTNRARIKTPRGPLLLTVPVVRGGSRRVSDIAVDYARPWPRKHLASIEQSYARAPHLNQVLELLRGPLSERPTRMAALNGDLIREICGYLGILTRLVWASSLGVETGDRNLRLIEICQRLGATAYLSGEGGRRYNDERLFAERGLGVEYRRFTHPEYPQLHGPFVTHLSIVDALFNCGSGAAALL
jgi:hypothetical protein